MTILFFYFTSRFARNNDVRIGVLWLFFFFLFWHCSLVRASFQSEIPRKANARVWVIKNSTFSVWYGCSQRWMRGRWKKRRKMVEIFMVAVSQQKTNIIWKNDDFWTEWRQMFRCTHENTSTHTHTYSLTRLFARSHSNIVHSVEKWCETVRDEVEHIEFTFQLSCLDVFLSSTWLNFNLIQRKSCHILHATSVSTLTQRLTPSLKNGYSLFPNENFNSQQ